MKWLDGACASLSGNDIRYAVKSIFDNRCGMPTPAVWNMGGMSFDEWTERAARRCKSPAFKTADKVKVIESLMPEYMVGNVIPPKYLLALLAALDYVGNAKRPKVGEKD